MNLRPRQRKSFSGFTKAEVEKMEYLSKESKDQTPNNEFYKNLARLFNRSSGRAGKPAVKWNEVKNWFQNRQELCPYKETSTDTPEKQPVHPEACILDKDTPEKQTVHPEACILDKVTEKSLIPEGVKDQDLSNLEFEAKSAKDAAWYDVDKFLAHRFLSSGEVEVRIRFVGFGAEEDEWVNVRNAVRDRSIPLEHSECQKVKVGDLVVCFQERQDQARYYDAHVVDVHRRLHDVRGCRCLFLIRYDHDNTEEKVRLKRLCCRPDLLTQAEKK